MKLNDTGRAVIFIVGAIVLVCVSAGAIAGPYEDCILQNMKGVQAQAAAGAIMRACREKTMPKKCRDAALKQSLNQNQPPEFKDMDFAPAYFLEKQTQCIEECSKTGYWSRTFGECATD